MVVVSPTCLAPSHSERPAGAIRLYTHNIYARHAGWAQRRRVLIDGIDEFDPDIVLLQEEVWSDDYDQTADIAGPDRHIVHSRARSQEERSGISIASRGPVVAVHEIDTYAITDSAVMFRRSLRRILRYPSMTLILVGMPIVFLLLFVYVLGGTLGADPTPTAMGPSGGRADYVAYVIPGILVLTVAATAQGTAITVAMDMTESIIARFRTMAIARSAVLAGHVLGSVVQSAGGVAVVLAVSLLIGFRPSAGAVDWLLATALIILISIAMIWLCVAFGLVTKTVESASNLPMFLTLLPFFGSGFVPTDSMPVGLRLFAEYQPFTPMIEALRGLPVGAPDPDTLLIAMGWCLVIGIGGYAWARILYRRPGVR